MPVTAPLAVTPLDVPSLAWIRRTDKDLALRIAEASARSISQTHKEDAGHVPSNGTTKR